MFVEKKEKELSWVSPFAVPVPFYLLVDVYVYAYTVRPLMVCACMDVRVATNLSCETNSHILMYGTPQCAC